MGFFEKTVDRRSRKAMTDFLGTHERYDTAGSWNRSRSYANCVKAYALGLTRDQENKALDMLDTAGFYYRVTADAIDEFTEDQGGNYTLGFNGRSGGYLVLYTSRYETTGHKSFCTTCGQRNFKYVPPEYPDDPAKAVIAKEILTSRNPWRPEVYLRQSAVAALSLTDDEKLAIVRELKTALKDMSATDKCGVCAGDRVNYEKSPIKHVVWPMRGIDQGEDFDPDEWTMDDLRQRVDLVCAMDRACDQMRDELVAMTESCRVVEEIIHVPQTRRRVECA